jgi:hypothetical protein
VAAGVIDNVDALSNLVAEKHVKRARGEVRPQRPSVDPKVLRDPQAVDEIVRVMQKIMCYVVIRPTVVRPIRDAPNGKEVEIPWGEREELPHGTIWADQVPEEDMAFIVNYAVGGTRDLAQFRLEFSEAMGALESGKSIPM